MIKWILTGKLQQSSLTCTPNALYIWRAKLTFALPYKRTFSETWKKDLRVVALIAFGKKAEWFGDNFKDEDCIYLEGYPQIFEESFRLYADFAFKLSSEEEALNAGKSEGTESFVSDIEIKKDQENLFPHIPEIREVWGK